MKTNWASTWFKFAQDLGDSMTIFIAKIDTSGHPEWTAIDHVEKDGVSAVAEALLGSQAEAPLANKTKPFPSPWQKSLAILKHIESPTQKIRWKSYNGDRLGKSPFIAWTLFTLEQTENLKTAASAQNVSLNSYLLFHLNEVVRNLFIESGDTRWSVPVNMRGLTGLATHVENQLAFIKLDLPEHNSPQLTHQQFKIKLSNNSHWASWALMHIGKYVGLNVAKKLYKKTYAHPNPDTGTFSSLGEWESGKIKQDENFIISAPTSKLTPIAVGTVVVNNKLSVALQIHPSLNPNEEIFRTFQSFLLDRLGQLSQSKFVPTPAL